MFEQIEKRKILSENKIEQLVRDTNLSIKIYISNASIEATTKIIKNKLNEKTKTDLINKSIKDLNSVIKN